MTFDETPALAELTVPEAGASVQKLFRHANANLTKYSHVTKCSAFPSNAAFEEF